MNEADYTLKASQKIKADLVAQKQRDEEIKNSNSDSLYAQALRRSDMSDKEKNTVIETALKEARKAKGGDLTQEETERTKNIVELQHCKRSAAFGSLFECLNQESDKYASAKKRMAMDYFNSLPPDEQKKYLEYELHQTALDIICNVMEAITCSWTCCQKIEDIQKMKMLFTGAGHILGMKEPVELFDRMYSSMILVKGYLVKEKNKCTELDGKNTSLKIELKKNNEKLNEVLTKLKTYRQNKYKKGQIKEAYKLFKNLRKDDTPCFNTFNNWLKLKGVPKGFPGIDDLEKFVKWAEEEWDAPERRKADKPIGGMSEEEIYRKRKR